MAVLRSGAGVPTVGAGFNKTLGSEKQAITLQISRVTIAADFCPRVIASPLARPRPTGSAEVGQTTTCHSSRTAVGFYHHASGPSKSQGDRWSLVHPGQETARGPGHARYAARRGAWRTAIRSAQVYFRRTGVLKTFGHSRGEALEGGDETDIGGWSPSEVLS